MFSPSFFRISRINSYSQCVILLSEVFRKDCSDSLNLQSFYNYAEQNQKFLFNKRFFEEKIGVPNSKKEIKMPIFQFQKEKYEKVIVSHGLLHELHHCDGPDSHPWQSAR